MPKISVIVPVYKVEPYLDRCVQSILHQTYSDFELILVDDGSPDHCPEMCDEYAGKDNRIVVIHKKNGGASSAKNAALDWVFANSDSEWIAFVDSDDWIHAEYLERLLAAALGYDVFISVCGFERTAGEQPEINDRQLEVRLWQTEDFYIAHDVNAIIPCAKLYKKELFKTVRYPVGKIYEDEFTACKLLFVKEKIAAISAPLYAYYQNAEGVMATKRYGQEGAFIECLYEQYLFFSRRKLNKAVQYQIVKTLEGFIRIHKLLKTHKDIENRKVYISYIKRYTKTILHEQQIRIRRYPGIYAEIYPIRSAVYWFIAGQLDKVRKKHGER